MHCERLSTRISLVSSLNIFRTKITAQFYGPTKHVYVCLRPNALPFYRLLKVRVFFTVKYYYDFFYLKKHLNAFGGQAPSARVRHRRIKRRTIIVGKIVRK